MTEKAAEGGKAAREQKAKVWPHLSIFSIGKLQHAAKVLVAWQAYSV